MNHLRAATLDAIPLKADTDTAARFAADVAVEIVGIAAFAELRPAWTDLLARADSPNLFMDPALLKAAAETFPEIERHVVLAWKPMQGERQLVGVWAFALGHPTHSVLPVRVLNAPPAPYGYLAAPVIDRTCT